MENFADNMMWQYTTDLVGSWWSFFKGVLPSQTWQRIMILILWFGLIFMFVNWLFSAFQRPKSNPNPPQ